MMTVKKMAKVVCEINRALASSRLQGVEGTEFHTSTDHSLCVDLWLHALLQTWKNQKTSEIVYN